METELLLRRLKVELPRLAYRYTDEKQLHDAVSEALVALCVAHDREVIIDKSSRVDFMLHGGVVLEVKVDGTFAQALHQVDRYLKNDDVTAVVILTTKQWLGRVSSEMKLRLKPVVVIKIGRNPF